MERIFDEWVDLQSPTLFTGDHGPIARWIFESNELRRLWRAMCRRRGWPDDSEHPKPALAADQWSRVVSADFTSRCHHVGHTSKISNARTRIELWDACDRIANQSDGRGLSEEQLRLLVEECKGALHRLKIDTDNAEWFRTLGQKDGREFIHATATFLRGSENAFDWVKPERLRHWADEFEKVASQFPAYRIEPTLHQFDYPLRPRLTLLSPAGEMDLDWLGEVWDQAAPDIPWATICDREDVGESPDHGAIRWIVYRRPWRQHGNFFDQSPFNPARTIASELRSLAGIIERRNTPQQTTSDTSNPPVKNGQGYFPVDLSKIADELFNLDSYINHVFPEGYTDDYGDTLAKSHWRSISELVRRVRACMPPDIALADCEINVRQKLRELDRFLVEVDGYPSPGSNFDELKGDVSTVRPIAPPQSLKDWSKRVLSEFLPYLPEPKSDEETDEVTNEIEAKLARIFPIGPVEPIERPFDFTAPPPNWSHSDFSGPNRFVRILTALTNRIIWEYDALIAAMTADQRDDNLRRRWQAFQRGEFVGNSAWAPSEAQSERRFREFRPTNSEPQVEELYTLALAAIDISDASPLLNRILVALERLRNAHLAYGSAVYTASNHVVAATQCPPYTVPDDIASEWESAMNAWRPIINALLQKVATASRGVEAPAPPVTSPEKATNDADASEGGATNGRVDVPAGRGELKECEKLAYASFGFAELRRESELQDREAYDWLKSNGFDESAPAILRKYKLPTFETWTKYVRTGRKHFGTNKNSQRAGRATGRSVVHVDAIESGLTRTEKPDS